MKREEYLLKTFTDHPEIMNDRVKAGIEANRKGYVHIKVVDKNGQPLPGAVRTAPRYTAALRPTCAWNTARKTASRPRPIA